MTIPVYILIIIFLMACSAFFSGSETAFFSVNRMRLQRLSYEGNVKARKVMDLIQKPRNLLLSILFGNELVNVSVSAVSTALWIYILGEHYGPIVSFFIMLFLLVLFSEITPKYYAINNPEKICNTAIDMMRLWFGFLYPVRVILVKFYDLLFKLFKIDFTGDDYLFSTEDFIHWLETNKDKNILNSEEYALIYQTLKLKNKQVKDIMTPRATMYAINLNDPIDEIVRLIKSRKYARLPVYELDLDRIIGILYVKDFLGIQLPKSRKIMIKHLHKVEYVSGYMKLNELLVYFMKRKIHLAIVTDEYGQVDGLVSFEDIIEELVGDIQDEFDIEQPLVTQIKENTFHISALMKIVEFNEQFKTNIEKENFETVGGFLLDKFGKIPKADETITRNGFIFKVLNVESNRIINVEVKKMIKGESH
jgi:putative hemolysin